MRARIFKNTSAYMLAGLAPYFVNFLMLPVYTRYMSPEDYGLLSLVNSFGAFFLCFAGLQLATSLGRFYFDYKGRELREFFSTILSTMVLVNIVLFVPLHFFGDRIAALVFPKADIPYDPYLLLALVSVFLGTFSPYFILMLKVQEKGGVMLRTSLLNTMTSLAFGVYFIVLKGMGAHGFLKGAVLTALIYNVLLVYQVRKFLVPAFRVDMLRSALAYSLPMIPHTLGAVVFIYSDKLILGYFVPIAAIGLYNIADRISMLFRLGINSFNDANSPTFMGLSKQSKEEAVTTYEKLITKWAVVVAFTYLGMAFFSEELIKIMTPPVYHGAYRFVPILLGAYIFRGLYCFAINTIMFEKKTAVIPLMTLAAGVCNVVGNIIFIPRFGTIVAAWTTLLSYILYFLAALYFSNKYYPMRYEWPKLARIFSLMILVLLAVLGAKTDGAATNVVLKMVGMGAFVAVAAKWNDGDIVGDLRALAAHLPGRVTGRPGR